MMNTDVAWNGIFAVTLPLGWVEEINDDVINIFDEENGVGSMQISFATRNEMREPRTEEAIELTKEFLREQQWNLTDSSIISRNIGLTPASETSVIAPDMQVYWRVWHIVSLKRVAFITYSCDLEDADVEKQACNSIIDSFRWLPS